MALPVSPNTTCDVYRSGNAPPAAPDVAAVRVHLAGDYERHLEAGEGDSTNYRYTHVLLCDAATDMRDGHQVNVGGVWGFGNNDSVYVPDKNGTKFVVRFVERRGRGTPADHKRVYLDREVVTWPTNEL